MHRVRKHGCVTAASAVCADRRTTPWPAPATVQVFAYGEPWMQCACRFDDKPIQDMLRGSGASRGNGRAQCAARSGDAASNLVQCVRPMGVVRERCLRA